MKVSDIDLAVRKLRRNILAAVSINRMVSLLTGWLFVWGTLTLIMRMATHSDTYLLLLIGIGGLAIVGAVSIIMAHRELPHDSLIRAKLDSINRGGGILIASSESDIHEWDDRITISLIPSAKWHNRSAMALLSAAAFFAIAAFIVPKPRIQPAASRTAANEIAKKLQEQIDILQEEELLEEERAETLEDNLERISETASDDDPIKTWEALDNVSDSINDIAEDAADKLTKTAEDAAAMEQIAENMQKAVESNISDSKTTTAAMQELASLMESKNIMNALKGSISPEMAQELSKALSGKKLSAQDLKKLKEALKKCSSSSTCKVGKLCKAGMIDPSKLAKCKSAASCSEAELMAFLDSECPESECLAMLACAACQKPGTGAPTRGRGDAPMTWTDGTDENGAAFKDETITPDALAELDKSRIVGISKTAPTPNKETVTANGGVLAKTASGNGSAWHQQVQPQHKKTVSRYFHRGEKNNE